jgi:hypothetical protein
MREGTLDTPVETEPGHRGRHEDYERVLDEFGAAKRPNSEAVRHLIGLGFRSGQARSAVHRYRERHGLLAKKPRRDQSGESPVP